ncbi:MAG: hydroxymethylglutaryl-CoA lyase [Vicinamibacterales bacterium]|jgi:hydroxymethylglutaryl-CoA lyase|nr:hydroxymethylglutaryl-CoA lyase [Vicinamibacterales bacterium]
MTLPPRVTIVEVGPRDGLQNVSLVPDTAAKVGFIDRLSDAGLPVVEVGAFVDPRRVPAMADTEAVVRAIAQRPGTRYTALVPNLRGLARAAGAGLREVSVFGAASDSFSRRNINQGIAESFLGFRAVIQEAAASGIRVRGYLSTSFGCPYEGDVPAERVAELTDELLQMGVFEVAISDTIGIAHPGQVWRTLDAVSSRVPFERVALHFHDTRGTGLANVLAGLQAGVTTFDASCGGLGGCPYAPGASGNLATEDLVYMLDGMGIDTGVSLQGLVEASTFMAPHVQGELPSRYLKAAQAATMRTRSERRDA